MKLLVRSYTKIDYLPPMPLRFRDIIARLILQILQIHAMQKIVQLFKLQRDTQLNSLENHNSPSCERVKKIPYSSKTYDETKIHVLPYSERLKPDDIDYGITFLTLIIVGVICLSIVGSVYYNLHTLRFRHLRHQQTVF